MNEDYANYKNREFICACGKNYLSYAALFTHIKQKHEGKVTSLLLRHRAPSYAQDHKGREDALAKIPMWKIRAPIYVQIYLMIRRGINTEWYFKGNR